MPILTLQAKVLADPETGKILRDDALCHEGLQRTPVAPAGRIQENRKNQSDKETLKRHLEDIAEGEGVLFSVGPGDP
jgi:hypothetical protein